MYCLVGQKKIDDLNKEKEEVAKMVDNLKKQIEELRTPGRFSHRMLVDARGCIVVLHHFFFIIQFNNFLWRLGIFCCFLSLLIVDM